MPKFVLYLYWGFVLLGLFFQYDLMCYELISRKEKIRRILLNVAFVFVLNYLWSNIDVIDRDGPLGALSVILLILYCFKKVVEKCPEGYSESLLLPLNSLFVTGLSFTSLRFCIIAAVMIVILATIIYKKWPFEAKSDYWEIVLLCGEAITISIITNIFRDGTFLVPAATLLFAETALYFINCCMMCIIKWLCGEDVYDYVYSLRKIY